MLLRPNLFPGGTGREKRLVILHEIDPKRQHRQSNLNDHPRPGQLALLSEGSATPVARHDPDDGLSGNPALAGHPGGEWGAHAIINSPGWDLNAHQ